MINLETKALVEGILYGIGAGFIMVFSSEDVTTGQKINLKAKKPSIKSKGRLKFPQSLHIRFSKQV